MLAYYFLSKYYSFLSVCCKTNALQTVVIYFPGGLCGRFCFLVGYYFVQKPRLYKGGVFVQIVKKLLVNNHLSISGSDTICQDQHIHTLGQRSRWLKSDAAFIKIALRVGGFSGSINQPDTYCMRE